MSLILPPLAPPITGHHTPSTYIYQRTADGYIRQIEIVTVVEFIHHLLDQNTAAYITQLSEVIDRPPSELFRTYDDEEHQAVWLHPELAMHLTGFKKPTLSLCIAKITRERLRYYGQAIIGLPGVSPYELQKSIHHYLQHLDEGGEFDPHELRIISIDIQGNRVDGPPDTDGPLLIVLEYVGTPTPKELLNIQQTADTALEDIDPEIPLEFIWKNITHIWW